MNTLVALLTIEMLSMQFYPNAIEITKGQALIFINRDSVKHNVVIPKMKVRTKYLKKGEEVVIEFNEVGEFDYHCVPHKAMGMIGVVKVKE